MLRFPTRLAAAASVAVAVAALAASCTQDFDQFFTGDAVGGAGGGGAGAGGSGAGGGSGCSTPADCPGVDTTCSQRDCSSQGECGTALAPAASVCT